VLPLHIVACQCDLGVDLFALGNPGVYELYMQTGPQHAFTIHWNRIKDNHTSRLDYIRYSSVLQVYI
jgi:hypothetical protein